MTGPTSSRMGGEWVFEIGAATVPVSPQAANDLPAG